MSRSHQENHARNRAADALRDQRRDRIRRLNDQLRTTLIGGRLMITPGVRDLAGDGLADTLRAVSTFCDFNADNDPHDEHDFGAVTIGTERVFWKIDYYDKQLEHGSPDPSCPEVTARVLTIMLVGILTVSLRFRLSQAAREIAPMQQGDLDGLCGLYAIINAVQIALYPRRKLRPRELTRLFACGLTVLAKTRRLRAILTEGMHAATWSNVCDSVLAEAGQIIGAPVMRRDILVGENIGARAAVRSIKRNLRDGHPVLVALMGSYNHSTVIVSFSATRFYLFDSRRFKWIGLRSISFGPSTTGVAHTIPSYSVVAVAFGAAASTCLEASSTDDVGERLAESTGNPDQVE